MRTIRQLIAIYRRLGLTQVEVADAMDVHPTTVGRLLERGTANSETHQRFDAAIEKREAAMAKARSKKSAKKGATK